jgi:hypothetical protein
MRSCAGCSAIWRCGRTEAPAREDRAAKKPRAIRLYPARRRRSQREKAVSHRLEDDTPAPGETLHRYPKMTDTVCGKQQRWS